MTYSENYTTTPVTGNNGDFRNSWQLRGTVPVMLTGTLIPVLSGTTGLHAEVNDERPRNHLSIATKDMAQSLEKKQAKKLEREKISRCFELQKQFGFNTAQWASILGVERKTLYNWKRNPGTQIQERIISRINLFESLAEYIDESHRPYLAKFAFGKDADKTMARILLDNGKGLSELQAAYDDLYTKIDGLMNRKERERRSHIV